MSAGRQEASIAVFENHMQTFERALDTIIKGAKLDENKGETILNEKGQYVQTDIKDKVAATLAINAWNVFVDVKLFLAETKKSGVWAIGLLNLAKEIQKSNTVLMDKIKKIIETSSKNSLVNDNELKTLIDASRQLLAYFYNESTKQSLPDNINIVIESIKNSTAVKGLSSVSQNKLNSYLAGAEKNELPVFLSQLATQISVIDQLVNPPEVVLAAPVAVQAVADQSIETSIVNLRQQQNDLKQKIAKPGISISELDGCVLENNALKIKIDGENGRLVGEIKSKNIIALQLKKDEVAVDRAKTIDVQKYLNDFVRKYNEVLKEYPTWWSYKADVGYTVLNKHLNLILDVTQLGSALGKALPFSSWSWSKDTQKTWEDFFAAEQLRLSSKIQTFDQELLKLSNSVADENKVDAKDAALKAEIDALSKESQTISASIEKVKTEIKRQQKIDGLKNGLDEYIEKRNKKYAVKDFFEEFNESISAKFGGKYKSEKTERKEYVEKVKNDLDAVALDPVAEKTKVLTDAMNEGLTSFKPRLAYSGKKATLPNNTTLRGNLLKINKELEDIIEVPKPQ